MKKHIPQTARELRERVRDDGVGRLVVCDLPYCWGLGCEDGGGCGGRGRLAGGMMPFMRRYSTICP